METKRFDPRSLEENAREIRIRALTSLYHSQSGHPGSSLSVADIVSTLFFDEMNWESGKEDRFILSKGHAVPAVYAALSIRGYIPEGELRTLRNIGSRLQGHPVAGTLPYIDVSTGSLGQGLSVGVGMAQAMKLKGEDRRVYVILGDGECQEGQVWEAAMSASKFGLDNLVVILDSNKYQNDGPVETTMPLEPLGGKWESFGWYVQRVDGHDISSLQRALKNTTTNVGKPSMIIADTIKGKGVSFIEENRKNHNGAMSESAYRTAMEELRSYHG